MSSSGGSGPRPSRSRSRSRSPAAAAVAAATTAAAAAAAAATPAAVAAVAPGGTHTGATEAHAVGEELAAAQRFFDAVRSALEARLARGGGRTPVTAEGSSTPVPAAVPPHVYGRIGTFASGEDMSRLARADRRCVFAFAAESAALLLHAGAWEVLMALGLQAQYMRYQMEVAKKSPYLFLFHTRRRVPDAAGHLDIPVHRATWAGVEGMVRQLLPEVAALVMEHLPVIAAGVGAAAFAALEAAAGYRMVEALTTRPELYMSVERYLALPCPRAVWQTRALLYCELRVLELFDGKGFTVDAAGTVGVPEYLVANTALADMEAVLVINLAPYTVIPPVAAAAVPPDGAVPRPSPMPSPF